MRIKIKPEQDPRDWHKFFVVWPRVIEGHWVLLETVERRFQFEEDEYHTYTWPEYRLYDPPPSHGWEGI